jgi:hypothetical protein
LYLYYNTGWAGSQPLFGRKIKKVFFKNLLTNKEICSIMYTSGEGNNRRPTPTAGALKCGAEE